MTYQELQTALKEYRNQGHELQVKLNAKKDILQAEYDRITTEIRQEKVLLEGSEHFDEVEPIEQQLIGQYTELACAVRLPLVMKPPKCELPESKVGQVTVPDETVPDETITAQSLMIALIVAIGLIFTACKSAVTWSSPYIFKLIDRTRATDYRAIYTRFQLQLSN